MELREFIKGVLLDITNAIKESQEEINNGVIISPTASKDGEIVATENGNLKISHIDFEVALTVDSSNGKNKGLGAGITVLSAFVGGKTEKEETLKNEMVSKIKFSIPLIYPHVVVIEKDKVKYSRDARF